MSIAAITGASSQLCALHNQLRNQFKQVGQDLQAGDLSKAQIDFVTLSQSAASQFSSGSSLAQAISGVGQALQSGDLSGAQQAFSLLAKVGAAAVMRRSHVPPIAGTLSPCLDQLGQALQSGDLSAARQAFATVQQLWQQISGTDPTSSTTAMRAASTTSVSA